MGDIVSKELCCKSEVKIREDIAQFGRRIAICHVIGIKSIRMHDNQENTDGIWVALKHANVPMEWRSGELSFFHASNKSFISRIDKVKEKLRKVEEGETPLNEVMAN